MRKYPLREQKASFVPNRSHRRPLPDTGAAAQPSTSVRRYPQVHVMREPVTNVPRRVSYRLPLPLSVIVGMGLMLALILSLGSIPTHVGNITEQWAYGSSRTAHFDARVGHGDEVTQSHFIAMNYRSAVHVIEFPGGDASRALVYVGPQLGGVDAESASVTLSFRDVNADDKPDMLIVVRGMIIAVFVNDVIKGVAQFRPARADENIVT